MTASICVVLRLGAARSVFKAADHMHRALEYRLTWFKPCVRYRRVVPGSWKTSTSSRTVADQYNDKLLSTKYTRIATRCGTLAAPPATPGSFSSLRGQWAEAQGCR